MVCKFTVIIGKCVQLSYTVYDFHTLLPRKSVSKREIKNTFLTPIFAIFKKIFIRHFSALLRGYLLCFGFQECPLFGVSFFYTSRKAKKRLDLPQRTQRGTEERKKRRKYFTTEDAEGHGGKKE
jgi:hypothetical protein